MLDPTPQEWEWARSTAKVLSIGELGCQGCESATADWVVGLLAQLAAQPGPVGVSGQPLADWLREWARLRPGQDAVNFLRCAAWIEKAKIAGVIEFDESGGSPGLRLADDRPRPNRGD